MKTILAFLQVAVLSSVGLRAQPVPVNVPELLRTRAGQPVATAGYWEAVRRPELLSTFQREVFGVPPVGRPPVLRFETVREDRNALGGSAILRVVRIVYGGRLGERDFAVEAFFPKTDRPVPVFVYVGLERDGLNTHRQPGDGQEWPKQIEERWPVQKILSRGFATAAFRVTDVAPDDDFGFGVGAYTCFERSSERTGESWGALSAWAWAASRVADWLETEPLADARHLAVVGHSRCGKTAILAAAQDRRFALCCSSGAGCCGDKLNHVELAPLQDEHIGRILRLNHFFCGNFAKYAGRDLDLPFDQHQLLALVAPRLLCLAAASEDEGAGPYGQFLSAAFATPAWELYGKSGLVAPGGFPAPGQSLLDGCVSFLLRKGGHDLTSFEWNRFMDFAVRHGWPCGSTGEFRAGFARRDMDPPMGLSLQGYFEPRPADGVLDPVQVNCVALSDGRTKAVLLSLDLEALHGVADEWRRRIAKALAIEPDCVYIACTHTHTGPAFGPVETSWEIPVPSDPAFDARLYERVEACAVAAVADLAPATISVARTECPGVSFIRRYRMRDGSVRTNPGIGNTNVVAAVCRPDESVQLVRFKRTKGDIALVNFACHPDVIGGCKYSADWPGFVRRRVEAVRPGAHCVFFNGAQGDSNHIDIRPEGRGKRGYGHSRWMGETVADAALSVWDRAEDVPSGEIRGRVKGVRVPLRKSRTPGVLETNQVEAYRLKMLAAKPDECDIPISTVIIGRSLAFAGLPGEPFSDIGRQVKSASACRMTFVTCQTNGSFGYIPDSDSFGDACYENTSTVFTPESSRLLVQGLTDALGACGFGEEERPVWVASARRSLMERFFWPGTSLFYDYRTGEGTEGLVGCLPTPEEIAANKPCNTGWGSGMEDSVLNGGPFLVSAIDRWEATGEREAMEDARKVFCGLSKMEGAGGVEGFLARSISPKDGKSFYPNSSRDQYTLFVYAIWRYLHSELSTAEERKACRKMLVNIARFMEHTVTKASGWKFANVDGRPGMVAQMWTDRPGVKTGSNGGTDDFGGLCTHEALRLPMIYAAAFDASGDAHWRDEELKYADDGLKMANGAWSTNGFAFALFQAQVSHRLLWELERDADRKARYLVLMRRNAGFAAGEAQRVLKDYAALGGKVNVYGTDWRQLPTRLTWEDVHQTMPIAREDFAKARSCVREAAECVLNALICPGETVPDVCRQAFDTVFARMDYDRTAISAGMAHALMAYWMERKGK